MVFYLTGIDHIWVSLPMVAAPENFPHDSEVIVFGQITRDSEELIAMKLQPYFLAERVYILHNEGQVLDIIYLDCDLDICRPQ